MLDAGQVTLDAMAWRPGAAGWAALSSYSELGAADPPPPPLPPPPAD
jgi:hypothetical protein